MILKIIDILNIENAINDLELNGIRLPFNISYKLKKNMDSCIELTNMLFERLELTIGTNTFNDVGNMSDEHKALYNNLLLTEIEIDLQQISKNALLSNNDILCRITSINYLEPILLED